MPAGAILFSIGDRAITEDRRNEEGINQRGRK
jgi:hypothetical protein